MKDELTFYACDTRTLEEKILPRDLIEGTEIAGHLERLGEHLGTLYFNRASIGEIFVTLEELTGAPFRFVLGRGERRLEPSGPVTYCGRQIPSELGELVHAIRDVQQLERTQRLENDDAARLARWQDFVARTRLYDEDPGALETLRRFLEQFRRRTPELISVYTCW